MSQDERLKFSLIVLALLGLVLFTPRAPVLGSALGPLDRLTARATTTLLRVCGMEVSRRQAVLSHPSGFAFEIYWRCTGLLPAVFLAGLILASPAGLAAKAAGVAVGIGVVLTVNFVRLRASSPWACESQRCSLSPIQCSGRPSACSWSWASGYSGCAGRRGEGRPRHDPRREGRLVARSGAGRPRSLRLDARAGFRAGGSASALQGEQRCRPARGPGLQRSRGRSGPARRAPHEPFLGAGSAGQEEADRLGRRSGPLLGLSKSVLATARSRSGRSSGCEGRCLRRGRRSEPGVQGRERGGAGARTPARREAEPRPLRADGEPGTEFRLPAHRPRQREATTRRDPRRPCPDPAPRGAASRTS